MLFISAFNRKENMLENWKRWLSTLKALARAPNLRLRRPALESVGIAEVNQLE